MIDCGNGGERSVDGSSYVSSYGGSAVWFGNGVGGSQVRLTCRGTAVLALDCLIIRCCSANSVSTGRRFCPITSVTSATEGA